LPPQRLAGVVSSFLISAGQGKAKMELKLIVLAGAKQGTEIPLKKDKFIIGRAKECTLRAGSEAISRRHCAITRSGDRWMVRDLGSRNGTHVNEVKIEQEVPLAAGDELRVGPLKFSVAAVATNGASIGKIPIPPLAPAAEVKPRKQPPVKDVAEAAQRSIGKSQGPTSEEDISNWLLGNLEPNVEETLKETRTISMQETKSLSRVGKPAGESVEAAEENAADGSDVGLGDETDDDAKPEEGSSGWKWFKRGGGKASGKPKPGKLPPRADQQTKDSREAAADILREMTRRR
jgi:pSer/pThr/pTyr-binding forkhead associated (FHA) protein